MKPRMLLIVVVLIAAMLACNMPGQDITNNGTLTPTGSLDILTAAAQTAEAGTGTPLAQLNTLVPSATVIGAPTATLAPPTVTTIPPTETPIPCDAAGFIQDVTIPDGAKVSAGQPFTKTWRLRNNGTCTWNTSYAMVFVSGNPLSAPAVVSLPGNVPPNATVDLSINMQAPTATGKYMSNWKLRNSTGTVFGVVGDQPFFVQIEVINPTVTLSATPTITATVVTATPTATTPAPAGLIYDFTTNMCKAEWLSAAGALPCPGLNGDLKGFVLRLANPTLETGAVETNPVLLTFPQAVQDGAITGRYPGIMIQNGYHFQAVVGCLNGAAKCSVKYQVNYSVNGSAPVNLGEWVHAYNNSVQGIDIDLSPQAGQSIQIILVVLANRSPEQAQAVWVYPRIFKP